jgi:hypothetical protein
MSTRHPHVGARGWAATRGRPYGKIHTWVCSSHSSSSHREKRREVGTGANTSPYGRRKTYCIQRYRPTEGEGRGDFARLITWSPREACFDGKQIESCYANSRHPAQ